MSFSSDDNAKALVSKKGISVEFGAREVDRVITTQSFEGMK